MDLDQLFMIVGAVGAFLLSVLAFRFVATFDFNKWQQRNDEKMHVRLQNACPHFLMTPADRGGKRDVEIKPLYVTTYGTTNWVCTQCNAVFPGELILPQKPTSSKDVATLIERQQEFHKLASKAGLL